MFEMCRETHLLKCFQSAGNTDKEKLFQSLPVQGIKERLLNLPPFQLFYHLNHSFIYKFIHSVE